tara:strand:- start:2540 stop:3460 length:921 start_codon:yes stop_codon:yes gene_type:complete
MKTSYQILWIDDDPNSTLEDREDVEEFLEEFGIRADITFIEALDDGSIRERIQHDLKNPELDVLVVDYHMEGMSGDELVHLIRETDHIYLPVIFYSSSSVEEILDAVREKKLDGVYIANRRLFIEKFKDVVRSLLAKEQTSKRTRGLLMEGVSEIDARFKEVFDQAWAQISEEQRTELRQYLNDIIAEKSTGAQRSVERFPADVETFAEHMQAAFVSKAYDTHTRWRVASKMLNMLEHDDDERGVLKELIEKPENQGQSLNSIRNEYAHKTRAQIDVEHTKEKCVEIRRELRRQQANMDGIIAKIV